MLGGGKVEDTIALNGDTRITASQFIRSSQVSVLLSQYYEVCWLSWFSKIIMRGKVTFKK